MKYDNLIKYKLFDQAMINKDPDMPNYYIEYYGMDGSSHYSAYMNYENALAEMPKYVEIAQKFDGGIVKLIELPHRCIRFKTVEIDNN